MKAADSKGLRIYSSTVNILYVYEQFLEKNANYLYFFEIAHIDFI